MSLKIAVISPAIPSHSLPPAHGNKGALWLWFNEIEAGFAFLLHESVDVLYIDNVLATRENIHTQKYQKLIAQLYPKLVIILMDLEKNVDMRSERIVPFPTLDTIFKNGELKTVFQPIVERQGSQFITHGIECLSRMIFNGQPYAPEFIFNYAAEKVRLTNYDRICLMQALTLVPKNSDLLIFVNLRPQTLTAEGFNFWFRSLLKQHQLQPEQIVIEVTEQYCNISEQEMITQCHQLHEQGVKLAIDDFGSGISNLSMLEIMKPNYIKISGRFTKNCHQDTNKCKIIKNVVDLAHDFAITPIVESVESIHEWLQVQSLGARLAQGFHFYQPMACEQLISILATT